MSLRALLVGGLCSGGLLVLVLVSACVGRLALPAGQVLQALLAQQATGGGAEMVHTILFGARLPRIG
ncbi:MAG: iron ABC transporter permease, partial [Komagataeibacter rhaeticus]